MKIEIRSNRVELDPVIVVYHAELEFNEGIWRETFGSRHDLAIWLKGVQAGYTMGTGGYVRVPDIPEHLFETVSNAVEVSS